MSRIADEELLEDLYDLRMEARRLLRSGNPAVRSEALLDLPRIQDAINEVKGRLADADE